ncbi:glycosyltransferase 87 family protein [Gaiella sp.]|uniref:glycosyltransferase 87 family protein n=1 Tax=Gaiella sp. TaxID=2663207 RepID=UPI00398378C4
MRAAAAVPAGVATLALVAAACSLAWQTDSPLVPRYGGNVEGSAPWFLVLLVAAFAAYLVGLAALRSAPASARATIVLAVAIQLVPVAAPLLISTDAWSYWSYGWIGSSGGGNPYSEPPQEFAENPALPWMGSAWLDTTSVYGPAFTAVSEPLALVAGGSEDVAAWTYKSLAAIAAITAALLAGRLSGRKAFAIAFVGWNPVLAIHAAGGGHNDAWVGALILAALALSASRRLQAAGVMWVLAIALKWVPILLLALRAVEARDSGRRTGHRGFASAAVVVAATATVLYGVSWPLAIFPLAGNAALETSYAIPHRLEQLGIPGDLAIGFALAAFLGGFAWLLREAGHGRARLGLAGCLALVTTPYLAVWYLAWAVPLAAADDDSVAIAACLVLCVYLLPQAIPV